VIVDVLLIRTNGCFICLLEERIVTTVAATLAPVPRSQTQPARTKGVGERGNSQLASPSYPWLGALP
jgi:hypothetical protein